MSTKAKIAERLLTVKSIVTLSLTIVFAALCIMGKLEQNFIMIYTVVISFYFGTQSNKQPTTEDTSEADKKEIGEAVAAQIAERLESIAQAAPIVTVQTPAARKTPEDDNGDAPQPSPTATM